MASSPKTVKVLFKDGTEGKAVKLTSRNYLTLVNWTNGEGREHIAKDGTRSKQRIRVQINGSNLVRVAIPDDYIVKTKAGFQVVKYGDSEQKIFFPDAFEPTKVDRAFNSWVKSVS